MPYLFDNLFASFIQDNYFCLMILNSNEKKRKLKSDALKLIISFPHSSRESIFVPILLR